MSRVRSLALTLPSLLALVLPACGGEEPPPRAPEPRVIPSSALAAPQAPPPKAPPVADASLTPRRTFFSNPDRTNVKLSPDGKYISFLSSLDGVLNVFVGPADAVDQARPVTHDQKRGIRSYTWAYTSAQVLYRQDRDGDENFHIHAVDLKTGEDRDLTPIEGIQARIEARSHKRPREIVVALNDRDKRYHDLWSIDVVSGKKRLLEKNDQEMAGFVTDDDLRVRVALKPLPDGSTELFERTPRDTKWISFGKIGHEDTLTTTPLAFDAAGKSLYLTDSRGRDTAALVAYDMATRQTRVLVDDGQADIEGATFDPVTNRPQAAQATYDRARWHQIDPAIAPDLEVLRGVAKGDGFDIVSRTQDDTRWLVAVFASDGPTRYFRYDRPRDKKARREAKFLFSHMRALEGLKLAPMHPSVLRARDGLSLVSYLTLPPREDADGDGIPDRPLPTVLLVHGGPWARDSWGYNPTAQWLASRGYAVLSVNYRGSTGFGKVFINAADGQWARAMHDDLLDAVAWAEKQKIAQRGKVAIMGGSYGGYATLVGLTVTPEVFACGIDIVGPSNLVTLLQSIPPYWVPEIEQFTRRIGDHRTEEGRKLLLERSPLTYADRITRPLLIGQGKNDPRVKQAESDQIVAAMQKKNIPVTYVLYPDEGHGFARPENRTSFNAVAEVFLAQCLGGPYQPFGDDFKGASITVPVGKEHVSTLPGSLR